MSEFSDILKLTKETGKAIGHNPEHKNEFGQSKRVICSCGWEGPVFWSEGNFGLIKWAQHIALRIEGINPKLFEQIKELSE